MKSVLIIVLMFWGIQEIENFPVFYYKNFWPDKDFRSTRVKYPIRITKNQNNTLVIENWTQGLDTLTNSPFTNVLFTERSNLNIVSWRDNGYWIQNEFTQIDGLWYLTSIRLSVE